MVSISRIVFMMILATPLLTMHLARGEEPVWHKHGSAYEQAREPVRLGQGPPFEDDAKVAGAVSSALESSG